MPNATTGASTTDPTPSGASAADPRTGGSLIEDHALIGDTCGVALVDRTGSIDWWCPTRVDAPACFAALLGPNRSWPWRVATSPTRSCSRPR
jgi:hypothetical protein